MNKFLLNHKASLILTLLFLLIGSSLYFGLDIDRKSMVRVDPAFFTDLSFKAAYTPDGDLKLFALADDDALATLRTSAGRSRTGGESVVIGSAEAAMMREEKLFSRPGDRLEGFFGIDTTVAGILAPTDTFLDDTHFLGAQQFAALQGDADRVFVKLSEEGMPKLFYTYYPGEDLPLNFSLSEGSLPGYGEYRQAGKIYQPVILGAAEAAMMREEKLFSKTGDAIEGFFGNDIVIAGVLSPTGTALDMLHLIPLVAGELS